LHDLFGEHAVIQDAAREGESRSAVAPVQLRERRLIAVEHRPGKRGVVGRAAIGVRETD
jgi:hypothetical protein